jgi:cytochrome oxidase Cu insertion factor (SCO1/SenC/PrrC family)
MSSPPSNPTSIVLRTVRWLAVGAVLGLGAAWGVKFWSDAGAPPPGIATAAIGGAFELVDQTGRTRTEADLAGKFSLIYFGFTYCPDACPTALLAMSEALDRVGPALAARVQPVFVTVDPERDTVQQMNAYVTAIDDRLMGLTGSAEQVARAARAYRVFYRKATPKDSADYLVDHTSLIYLMGPDGKYVSHFTHETSVERIEETLRRTLGG